MHIYIYIYDYYRYPVCPGLYDPMSVCTSFHFLSTALPSVPWGGTGYGQSPY